MIDNFFRINFPYGLIRNDNNEWMLFNREYMPLGYNNRSVIQSMSPGHPGYNDLPIYTKYKGLTEGVLRQLGDSKDSSVRTDPDGKIWQIFLYDDGTNPTNVSDKKTRDLLFEVYFSKMKVLSLLKT